MEFDDASDVINTSIDLWNKLQYDEQRQSRQTPIPTPLEPSEEVTALKLNRKSYPAIYISYQWNSRMEAMALHRCLTELGFTCWIDVEQVKEGDDLYTKLYEGLTNSKIVISCVTAAYLKSLNCRKEVVIAHETKKVIIPLILEKTDVSSIGGSISFIMATLLYIECVKECKLQWRDPNDATKFAPKQLLDKLSKELEIEMQSYPAIFISYQWNSQKEVICLYRCLTELGFSCWIDVEQVKVGDDLYKKIYEGVSKCKILISCITPAYMESDNCRKETLIAHEMKKLIIPLILEKTDVSSIGGSMSFIMGSLIFFDCAKECKQQWRDPIDSTKFAPKELQEKLCKALKLEIQNSLSKVEIKAQVSKPKPATTIAKKTIGSRAIPVSPEPVSQEESKLQWRDLNDTEEIAPKQLLDPLCKELELEIQPQIFISYQRDSKSKIEQLYKQLTDIGFTCWMDTDQISGGDKLYPKIEEGLRNCKVVLLCLTMEYTKSDNCKLEMDFTHLQKRNCIPLMLEKLPWPPVGFIVLSSLVFIDFSDSQSAKNPWKGKNYEQLTRKIDYYVNNRRGQSNPIPIKSSDIGNSSCTTSNPESNGSSDQQTSPKSCSCTII